MLRSQSISNLNDQRKSKSTAFFSSFRSRKFSSNDLHSIVDSTPTTSTPDTNTTANQRPLSASVSSINLSGGGGKLQPIKHSSSAAQQRLYHSSKSSISTSEDKENIVPASIARTKSLKLRSSAPNLNLAQAATTSANAITVTSSNNNNNASQLYTRRLRSSMFLNNIISNDYDSLKSEYKGRISPPVSFMSPETIGTVDTLVDQSPIKLTDFENTSQDFDSEATLSSFSNSSTPTEDEFPERKRTNSTKRKLHRTTNSYNINEFIKILKQEDSTKLPVNNRKSLELESLERKKLTSLLNANEVQPYKSTLSLIGNSIFLVIKDNEIANNNEDNDDSIKFSNSLEDIDYIDALREDGYDDIDEQLVMVF
ncbi:uncharacterized protein RJT21DRAFT_17658 [Scheffersomyces amazonensis]|uniref:uncharacterized protein n=1 Tax=Scheffersomyces amazonensis TaxID=1078765 RepID=UPI00315D9857